jgi:hypothetical protein
MNVEDLDFYLNLFEKIGFKLDTEFLNELLSDILGTETKLSDKQKNKISYLIKRGAVPTYREYFVKELINNNDISGLNYLLHIDYIPKDKIQSLITYAKKNDQIVKILEK